MVSFRSLRKRFRRKRTPRSRGGIGRPVIRPTPRPRPSDIKKDLKGGTTKTTGVRVARAPPRRRGFVGARRSGRSRRGRKQTKQITKVTSIKKISKKTKVNLARQPRFRSTEKTLLKRPPQGTVEAVIRPSGIFLTPLERARERRRKLQVEKLRSKPGITLKSLKREGKLAGLVLGETALATLQGFKQLPKTAIDLVKNPKNIISGAKAIPSKLKQAGSNFGDLARISPTEAVAKIGSEIILLKVTSRGLEAVGKVTENVAVRLSPKFVGKANTGAKLIVKTSRGKKIIRVVKRIPTEAIKKQSKLAGRTTTAVSSQADDLVRLIRRKKLIRKPIPGEAGFSRSLRTQLKRFDKGKLTPSQAIRLDRRLRKVGAKGILERSFFADPRGRVRPSRLGIRKTDRASIIDILSGDVKFKRGRPQILIFPDAQVQKFPQALQKIQKKLKLGKALTKSEADELVKFQLKRSGKFKPVGFATRESEITLAPGELIKRRRVVGKTIVDGRVVNIVEVKVVKASKTANKLLKKANQGKLSTKELKRLGKVISKESGFKTSISSSSKTGQKFLSGRAILGSLSARVSGKVSRKMSKRTSRRTSSKSSSRPSSRPRSRTSSRPRSRTSSRPRPSRSSPRTSRRVSPKPSSKKSPRSSIRPRPKPTITKKKLSSVRRRPVKRRVVQGFNVFGKIRGKFVRLNKKPLSKRDALDRMSVSIDRTTARTGKIKSIGNVKKLGKLRKGERGSFKRARQKFRRAKIRRGKRIRLTNTYIEKKGRPLIDTKGEKSGLSLSKFRKRLGVTSRTRRTKRRVTKKRKMVRRPIRRKIKRKPIGRKTIKRKSKRRKK